MCRFTMVVIAIAGMLLTAGCGQNSVGVNPASADAQNFPGGMVSFSATGVRNPTWCIGTASGMCNGNIASIATIDTTGHAQCLPGRSGTVTVLAGMSRGMHNPDGGFQLSPFGSAQLMCP